MKTCCPICGDDISDTYQEAEPDVGIMRSGWWCEACDVPLAADEEDDEPNL